MQQRSEQVMEPPDPHCCGEKQTVSPGILCGAGLCSAFPKATAQSLPWGRHCPLPSPPRPHPWATPVPLSRGLPLSETLRVPQPPFLIGTFPEAWPPCRLSLVCRTSFQIHVKSIIFLACTRPDTHHSSPPSRSSENRFLFIKKSDGTAPL